ncbi:unnamed protein product [Rotaria sordida]|uniref:Prohibitin n=1 Tax=Rotaria sordida TaxID=392033 RepID=A0A815ZVA4_9BILA|nr:unnamed protein product [Rotaria sordida]CAF1589678.1 unnamed protein product [Rotaria sordida]
MQLLVEHEQFAKMFINEYTEISYVNIFMVQHPSHTLLQQNGFTQQVYLKYKQECLDGKKTVPAFEAIAAAVAKNSDTSNSLKPNEEFSVLGRIDIGLGIGGGVINCMLYNVDDGHQDVIFDHFQSVKLDVIEEGTHFMISWLHRPIIFDIRTRPRSVPSITEIKDIKARREQSTSGER